jgi:hypothetical protein
MQRSTYSTVCLVLGVAALILVPFEQPIAKFGGAALFITIGLLARLPRGGHSCSDGLPLLRSWFFQTQAPARWLPAAPGSGMSPDYCGPGRSYFAL